MRHTAVFLLCTVSMLLGAGCERRSGGDMEHAGSLREFHASVYKMEDVAGQIGASSEVFGNLHRDTVSREGNKEFMNVALDAIDGLTDELNHFQTLNMLAILNSSSAKIDDKARYLSSLQHVYALSEAKADRKVDVALRYIIRDLVPGLELVFHRQLKVLGREEFETWIDEVLPSVEYSSLVTSERASVGLLGVLIASVINDEDREAAQIPFRGGNCHAALIQQRHLVNSRVCVEDFINNSDFDIPYEIAGGLLRCLDIRRSTLSYHIPLADFLYRKSQNADNLLGVLTDVFDDFDVELSRKLAESLKQGDDVTSLIAGTKQQSD